MHDFYLYTDLMAVKMERVIMAKTWKYLLIEFSIFLLVKPLYAITLHVIHSLVINLMPLWVSKNRK